MNSAGDIVTRFDEPGLGGTLFRKLFFASNAAAIGVGGAPDD
jgi:hypothetical protein